MSSLRLASFLLTGVLAGCGGCGRAGLELPAPSHLRALVVIPGEATMFVGERLFLRALAAFDDGSTRDLAASEVAWSSADPSRVAFEAGAAVARASGGPVVVTATVEGLKATSSLTVSAAGLVAFEVAPSHVVLAVGESVALAARVRLADGTVVDVSGGAAGTVWASSEPGLASVSADGLVRGLAAGAPLAVTARNGDAQASASVRVTALPVRTVALAVRPTRLVLAAGTSGLVRAIATLSDGTELDLSDDPSTTWSSAVPDAVAVDAHGGLVAQRVASRVAVTAGTGGLRAASLVDVTEAALVSLSLAPAALTLAAGGEGQLVLTARYADGHAQDVTRDPRVEWVSDDALRVAVSGGTVRARAAGGPVAVAARLAGKEARATVVVLPSALTGLVLAPADADVRLGTTLALALTGQLADGSTRDLTAAASGTAWEVEPAGLVRVDDGGGAHAERVGGPVTVTARNGGKEATAVLRVVAAPDQLVSLAFVPAELRLDVGDGAPLHLVGTFGDGHTADLSAAASRTVYASADRALVEVSADGLVRAFARGGPVAVSGSNGGLTAVASVLVAEPAPEVVGLAVDPKAVTGRVSDTVHLHVTATLTDHSARDVTAASSGTTYAISGDPAVASVSPEGVVSCNGQGSAAVVVTNGVAHTFATIDVAARTLIDLKIAPGRLDLPVGLTDRLVVTGVFTDGSTADLTAATSGTVYASSRTNIASVDPSGHVLALAVGNAQVSVASGGLIRRVAVRVRDAQVVGVALSPPAASVVAGRSVQLTCTAMLDTGRLVDVTSASSGTVYLTATPALATIGPDGLLHGVAAGATQVTCINRGSVAASAVTVTPPVADEVRVSPEAARLPRGRVLPLAVTVRLSDGTVRDASGAASGTLYFSSDRSLAPVSDDGVVTGLSEGGPVTVTALVAGSTRDATVTVVPPAVDALACRPSSLSLLVGASAPLAVEATWSDGRVGRVASGDGPVFRVEDGRVALVDDAGVVTGAGAGATVVFAYLAGLVARCPVEVTP